MKKLLLVALILLSFVSYGQWRATGNNKLDSLMFANEKELNRIDSLEKLEKEINFGVERTVDKFTNEVKINTQWKFDYSILYKYIHKGKTTYYLSLRLSGATLNYGCRGVIVLFTDGTKWVRSYEKIDVNYSDGIHYSAFMQLTPNDIQLFSKKYIMAYKLYIYDTDINIEEATLFKNGVNKIKFMK